MSGFTSTNATWVRVNGEDALLYAENLFAATNVAAVDGTNRITGTAQDSLGRKTTNALTINLPGTLNYTNDPSGNLFTDGG